MKKIILSILIIFGVFIAYLQIFNRIPENKDNIKEAYYHCDDYNALYGGRLTKGPTRSFRTIASYFHVHDWKAISKDEFKRLASLHYGIIWENEPGSFFNGRWEMIQKQDKSIKDK